MRTLMLGLASMLVTATACGSSGFDAKSEGASAPPNSNGGGDATQVAGDSAPIGSGGENGAGGAGGSGGSDSGGPSGPLTVTTNETVDVWGTARTFVLVMPKAIDPSKAYPIVFMFHGDGGNGVGMQTWLTVEKESGASAIVVYPDGKDASWDLYTPEASNQDFAFVDAMLAAIEKKALVDRTRIFGSGYSSGAFFVNQIACRRSAFFRAIVSNAGGAPQEPQDPTGSTWSGTSYTKCATQSGGVAALVIHGSDDYVVGTTSGTYDAKYWAYVNGCDDSEDQRTPTAPAPCVQHASCPTGKSVVYCEIPGIGHGVWTESTKASWAFFGAQ